MASAEKLPSGRWRGVYRDSGGKKRTVKGTFRRKADAREAAQEAEVKARRTAAANDGTLSARTSWGAWWEIVSQTREFESDAGRIEQQLVRSYVLPRWRDVPLNKIAQRDIQKWVEQLERGKAPVDMVDPKFVQRPLSASYVQRVYSPFRVSITRALDEGILDASPCAGVKLPKRQKRPKVYMSADEATKLAGKLRPDYADAVLFMIDTGLRPGELTGLHAHRVDLVNAVLTVAEVFVFRQKRIRPWPKDRDAREVPLSARAVEIARRRLAGRDPREPCGVEHMRGEKCAHPLVFLTEAGKPLNRDILGFHLRKAAEAVGVHGKSGYALRRGFATRLAEGGLDVFQLAEVMGHSDINLSREYVQQTSTARARVLAALGEAPTLSVVDNGGVGQRGTRRGTNLDNQALREASKTEDGNVG
ncbi:integrase [Saccharomonospora amisosensis]|uniref:Integrase n=1 Tax=Saccharomonospora amisosensis TaxID=1128677 RepID=A0A7X5UM93_9PSEU|nr:tyrosine-type recombinase/integrase [Saccharomonospora amisosensis]NIJ10607.1 integrase [Saccharomonospora amisosensis]